jgi:hypothetical protein
MLRREHDTAVNAGMVKALSEGVTLPPILKAAYSLLHPRRHDESS